MGLFQKHNQKLKSSSAFASTKSNAGEYFSPSYVDDSTSFAGELFTPITKTFKSASSKQIDSDTRLNLNCYFIQAAALCYRSAISYLRNGEFDPEYIKFENEASSKLKELDARLSGTIFDTFTEKSTAKKVVIAFRIIKSPTQENLKNVIDGLEKESQYSNLKYNQKFINSLQIFFSELFENKEECTKLVDNFRLWCTFVGLPMPLQCMAEAGTFGYNVSVVPVFRDVFFEPNFEFTSAHPYCKEFDNFYEAHRKEINNAMSQ